MRSQKLHVLLCFGPHGKNSFKGVLPIIEKFRPDVIAPEGVDYTESLRRGNADAYRTVRRRLSPHADGAPSRSRINKLLGAFPPEDEPFAECEYREALARNSAYFPIEVHKKKSRFNEDFREFLQEQVKIPASLAACSYWGGTPKWRLEETAQNFLFASRKFAISSIERENDIIRSVGSYKDDLLRFYPELSGNGEIRAFSHFGTYHVGIHYFGKRHYSGDGCVRLSKSTVSLDCPGNLCSLFIRFGKIPPAGALYQDLISLSQISKAAYGFLEKNEECIVRALKPLIRHLKAELLP